MPALTVRQRRTQRPQHQHRPEEIHRLHRQEKAPPPTPSTNTRRAPRRRLHIAPGLPRRRRARAPTRRRRRHVPVPADDARTPRRIWSRTRAPALFDAGAAHRTTRPGSAACPGSHQASATLRRGRRVSNPASTPPVHPVDAPAGGRRSRHGDADVEHDVHHRLFPRSKNDDSSAWPRAPMDGERRVDAWLSAPRPSPRPRARARPRDQRRARCSRTRRSSCLSSATSTRADGEHPVPPEPARRRHRRRAGARRLPRATPTSRSST